jgi:hypothetical protein
MDFKVIGMVPMIGKESENGTNHRIFVPFDTVRNLFPLKAQNSENAISFLNYRPIKKELDIEAMNEVQGEGSQSRRTGLHKSRSRGRSELEIPSSLGGG